MTTQNYLIIENDAVTNCVEWDGNTQTWTPPANSIQLVQSITPALVWMPVKTGNQITDWVLEEVIGEGDIGFTWNTTTQVLTTNEPKPAIPVQPTSSGLQNA